MKQILTILFLLSFSLVNATIINVPTDQPTIQAGIDFAIDADTVLVQPGTYVESINFNGKLITVGSLFLTTQDTTYISSTIIDGNNSGSVITFTNNENSSAVLSGFTVTQGYAFEGGGINCNNSSPSLKNLTITGNAVSGLEGGGIYCYESSPILQNVTIIENTAEEKGGGIYCEANSNPNLNNITITDNTAAYGGGGIYCYWNCNPILQNVTISYNAAGWGGGIYCELDSSPSLEFVLISNNYATRGGGIFCNEGSHPSLVNVTMSGNTAAEFGGGIWSFDYMYITNSILWDNSPEEIYGSAAATFSDIEGGWTGTGNIDSDPLFIDPANGDYHLTENSPCIDAGDPASPLDPDGTITDMGAYFYPQFIPPEADFEADVTSGEAPLDVQFSDLTVPSYNPIISWHWDFDNDGSIDSNEQNPIYIYNEIGVYTVSLTVSDGYSDDTEIKEDYIEVTGAGTELNIIPFETFLGKNYPNPFNPTTTIQFDIKENENGVLTLFNIKGQIIELQQFESGKHNYLWDASKQASGIYLYKLQTQTITEIRKMLLLK